MSIYKLQAHRSLEAHTRPTAFICGGKDFAEKSIKIHGGIYYEYGSKNKHNGVKR